MSQAALSLNNAQTGLTRANGPANEFRGYRQVKLISHDASYVEIHREQRMTNANGQFTRTNAEPTSQWLKDNGRIKARLADALEQDHGHKHSHLKLIARETGASPRTVEKWKDAQYLMGVEHFLRLIPSSPAIQKMLAELMTLDPDTDPRHGALLAQIQRTR
jgi:hypothetical protein